VTASKEQGLEDGPPFKVHSIGHHGKDEIVVLVGYANEERVDLWMSESIEWMLMMFGRWSCRSKLKRRIRRR